MFVPRIIDVLVPLFIFGYLMLVVVRFIRGTNPDAKNETDGQSERMWRILGRVFLLFGVYFFFTRFFR